MVSINSDAVPAALNNQQFHKIYGVDNPNLKLIAELRQAGVEVSICDQSVAFHHLQRDWIDKSVTHTTFQWYDGGNVRKSGLRLFTLISGKP